MTDRNVTVRLKMTARDYITTSTQAERATRRLADAQRDMAASARLSGEEIDRTSRKVEQSGRRTGRGMMYAAAGVAALGAAGGGLKVLPGLIGGAAVAGGALPPMFLGAAGAVGVLVTSLKGVPKAIGEVTKVDDPFESLGQNAINLVAQAKALQPAMRGFRQGIQDKALEGASRNLNALATQALPAVSHGLGELATDWSQAFRQITLSVTDPHFTSAFNIATRGADDFFDLLNARIQPSVASLSTLVKSADPLARAFGQSIIGAIDRFNAKIAAAAQSGKLDEFFRDGAESAGAFLDLAQDVARITGQVIAEVSKQGNTLRDTGAQLAAYIASGRSAADVAGIINTLTVAYEGVRDVLGPLAGMARDALADPGTAQAIGTMFDVLQAGTAVLRVVFDLFQMLPDGMQATVLAAVALTLVAKKLSTGLMLVQVGATKAAASLTATGAAGAIAGRGMTAAAGGVGKAVGALLALQLAGVVLDQFDGAATDVTELGRAIEDFASKGKVGGEVARLFGDDMEELGQHAKAAGDSWLPKLGRTIESLIPPTKSLNEMIFGGSWAGSKERVEGLDTALVHYAQTTGDLTGAQKMWNEAFNQSGMDMSEFAKLMPASTAELQRMQAAAHANATGMAANAERADALAGSFQEASLRGKDLATTLDLINGKNITAVEGQIALEAAYDQAAETVDEYGRVTKKGTHEINLNTEAGRASMTTLIGISTAAKAAADSEVKRTGKMEDGVAILNTARDKFIALAAEMTGSKAAAEELANQIIGIPDKDVKVDADTKPGQQAIDNFDSKNKGRSFNFPIKASPNPGQQQVDGFISRNKAKSFNFPISVSTGAANARLQGFFDKWGRRTFNFPITTSNANAAGGVHLPRAGGGYSVPYGRPVAAAMGLARPDMYPASDPPLYQFAERQTGGELFLPRRGIDRERGRGLLAVAASWYGGMFVPMARGGVVAAQSGLVNVAPATTTGTKATRLDYAEAYLRARDAVKALSVALNENGRAFSYNTVKGRENLSAVHSSIRAAEEAARVKFEETGSVKAANAAYAAHIAALRKTLAQQKVNAATINKLLSLATPPAFTAAASAPKNSQANIAFAKSNIAAVAGLGGLGDALSLNRPGISINTPEGRENLLAIIGYLETIGGAAQDRFSQTGNAKTATTYYNALLGSLRKTLQAAGYSKKTIDGLFSAYGRITLTRNDRGGIYMAAAGGLGMLDTGGIYPGSGAGMYGWAEKSTGGEMFLPRLGDRARADRLLAVGAGWYGGRYTPAGGSQGAGTTINNNLTVHGRMDPMTIGQLSGFMRQMDAEARVGRRK
jgi:hypothetical protein